MALSVLLTTQSYNTSCLLDYYYYYYYYYYCCCFFQLLFFVFVIVFVVVNRYCELFTDVEKVARPAPSVVGSTRAQPSRRTAVQCGNWSRRCLGPYCTICVHRL